MIIPDDYARSDVLARYFHHDNRPFVESLRQRGFTISAQARSPYSDSESNIAAELNMDYLDGLPRILGARSQDVRPLKTLIEDNRTARMLRPLGYRYVHLDTDEVTFAAGNPDISSVATPDSFPSLWLRKSVLRLIGGPAGFDDAAAQQRYRRAIRSGFARLAAGVREPGPRTRRLPHAPAARSVRVRSGGPGRALPGTLRR